MNIKKQRNMIIEKQNEKVKIIYMYIIFPSRVSNKSIARIARPCVLQFGMFVCATRDTVTSRVLIALFSKNKQRADPFRKTRGEGIIMILG